MEIIIRADNYTVELQVEDKGNGITATIRDGVGGYASRFIDRTQYGKIDTLVAGITTFSRQLYQTERSRFGGHFGVDDAGTKANVNPD